MLKKNYRSRQGILDLSYRFIKFNDPYRLEFQINQKKNWQVDNHLLAAKKGKAEIQVFHFSRQTEEVSGVVKKIQELLKTVSPREIAILARTHQTLRPFETALQQAGIDYQSFTAESLYRQPMVVDFLAYLQVLDNPFQDAALYKVLNLPFWKIKTETISRLIAYRQKQGKPLFECLLAMGKEVHPLENEKLKSFFQRVQKDAQFFRERKISEGWVKVLEETGWLKWLVAEEEEKRLTWLNQFYDRIREFEENDPHFSLHSFLQQAEMIREEGGLENSQLNPQEGPESVKIMTVHASKGLEFEYVFLVGLISQRFPSTRRNDPIPLPAGLLKEKVSVHNIHLEEERRLFYVAMTRAKKGLFFTWADDYGGLRQRRPSRFLQELGFDSKAPEENTLPLAKKKQKRRKKVDQALLPDHFSYTQFFTFQTCPRQYKFTHILKLPARGGASRSFGKTIHKTLEIFLKSYVLDPKFKATWLDLQRLYQENWLDDWYENEKERKKYFQDGKKQLKLFWRDFQKNRPQVYTHQGEPFLEKSFILPFGDYSLRGKIDRIDIFDEGVEIIDYKTGHPLKKLNPDHKRQLLFYQIAAEEVFGLQPKKLSFYYLENGSKLSFLGNEKEKQATKEKMLQIIKEIQNSSFPPTKGRHCRYCDYRQVCEYY